MVLVAVHRREPKAPEADGAQQPERDEVLSIDVSRDDGRCRKAHEAYRDRTECQPRSVEIQQRETDGRRQAKQRKDPLAILQQDHHRDQHAQNAAL